MSFLNLKHIPCPAGPGCTSTNCLFRHDGDPSSASDPTTIPAFAPEPTLIPTVVSPAPLPTTSHTNPIAPIAPIVPEPVISEPTCTESPITKTGKRSHENAILDEYDPAATQSKRVKSDLSEGSAISRPSSQVQRAALVSKPSAAPKITTSSSSSTPNSVQISIPVKPQSLVLPSPSVATPSVAKNTQKRPLVSVRACDAAATKLASASPTVASKSPTATNNKQAEKVPISVASTPHPPPNVPKKVPPPPQNGVMFTPRTVPCPPLGFAGRLKVIQMLHTELLRLDALLRKTFSAKTDLFLSQDEADRIALDIEHKVAAGSSAVYRNVVGSRLAAYKKMKIDDWVAERHLIMNPPKPRSADAPIITNTGLTLKQEEFIAGLLLTPIHDMAKYGYVPVQPKAEDVAQAAKAVLMSSGWEKCDRCEQRFQVFPDRRIEDGAHTSGGKCTHHPGRLYFPDSVTGATKKTGRSKAHRKYRCCNQGVGDSSGCTVSDCHVFKVTDTPRLAHVMPFKETPPNNSPATEAKVVCFDCEMCYTVYGIELVRLTATSWPSGDNILDVLVRPQGAILDLNSRYSGVFPKDITNAPSWTGFEPPIPAPEPGEKTVVRSGELKIVESPSMARDLLFKLITPDTILVGHGLENDLNATRIIHPKIIDTVLLFPHNAGLPIRNGLKALASAKLNWKIQTDDGQGLGHDSAEDARAAGELVRVKIKEKWISMQSRGWKIVDGQCVGPS